MNLRSLLENSIVILLVVVSGLVLLNVSQAEGAHRGLFVKNEACIEEIEEENRVLAYGLRINQQWLGESRAQTWVYADEILRLGGTLPEVPPPAYQPDSSSINDECKRAFLLDFPLQKEEHLLEENRILRYAFLVTENELEAMNIREWLYAVALGRTKEERAKFDRCGSGRTFTARATAYSSTPDQTDSSPFHTATGTHVHWGTLAVNPQVIPYGCHVRISSFPGTVFTAEDTGGALLGRSDRVDIWFPTREEAIQFGVQSVKVTIE